MNTRSIRRQKSLPILLTAAALVLSQALAGPASAQVTGNCAGSVFCLMGNTNADRQTMRIGLTETERMCRAVQLHQAFTGVAQAHAIGVGNLSVDQFNSGPVIADFQQQIAGKNPGGYAQVAALFGTRNAILDGVFHHRLQQQAGDQGTGGFLAYVQFQVEPFFKADFLDVQVQFECFEFLLQATMIAVVEKK